MPFWSTSTGPGPKPLDSSIFLKFLLGTRLKSESFDAVATSQLALHTYLSIYLGHWQQQYFG